MNYQLTFKKIFSSQYLFTGIRIAASALIPALVLFHFDSLAQMSAIPLGALVVGSTDSPGPFLHRRNTILASIGFNFLVVVITISLNHNPVLIALAIVLFGMFFSLIGIYGARVNSVGIVALLVFIFNIDSKASYGGVFFNGLLFTAGGLFYFLMSLLLHRLRPYRYLQLQLGESIRSIADYTNKTASLFRLNHEDENLFSQLRQQQITIQQEQDSLREMLLSTREMVIDSTVKGRIIMMMFLDSVDLFEQVLSLQLDYTDLHTSLDDQEILTVIETTLIQYKDELNAIGYAIQFNQRSHQGIDIDAIIHKIAAAFKEERKKRLNKNTIPLFIKLRQIKFALQEIGERIKRLHHFSGYEKMATRQYQHNAGDEVQRKPTEISPRLLLENLTLKSAQFKHALRVTIGLLAGYAVSLFFPVAGHGYWIVMTIATILRPGYSISKTRNIQRLSGNVTGVIVSFVFLYFVSNNTLAFLLLLCTMVTGYALLKVNYYISCTCISIFVLISFHFLNKSQFTEIVFDRFLDTAIGCAIAFVTALLVFPVWENEQTKDLIKKLVTANQKYFDAVIEIIKSPEQKNNLYKSARKDAFVALANLSGNFQRILSDKRKDKKIAFYHQFVSSSYMLTAHIASLSNTLSRTYFDLNIKDFDPLINNINDKFKHVDAILNNKEINTKFSNRQSPITNKVQELMKYRAYEIEHGIINKQTSARVTLRELKIITDEFEIIDSLVADEVKISKKLKQ
ncbi:MAG: FUSC family protein [Bacteroidetes bacterium]|nr:FUSC family protein [Bacteroidota bacterium]